VKSAERWREEREESPQLLRVTFSCSLREFYGWNNISCRGDEKKNPRRENKYFLLQQLPPESLLEISLSVYDSSKK
jgi:hypothetical protein